MRKSVEPDIINTNEESSHVVPDLHIDRKGLTYNRSVSIIRDKEEPVGAHFKVWPIQRARPRLFLWICG